MAMVNGVVEGVSTKFEGKVGILVNGKWYNTKTEWAPSPLPNKGDNVSFDDGGKNFIKKLKVTGGAPAAGSGGGYGKANIGIEVGHASNLAMRMMEQWVNQETLDDNWIGSEEYFKMFTDNTLTIYRLMQGIRKSVERGEGTKAQMESIGEKTTESEDIF